jgi:membrane-bound lytic murein transglycosylase B
MDSLRRGWERMNNRWNQWVLNYSRTDQFELLERLGVHSPSWEDLAIAIVALVCGASLAGAAWAWWDRKRQDPWQRLQARVRDRLADLGVAAEPHEPPRALAARVREQLGEAGTGVAAALDALDRCGMGKGRSASPIPRGGARSCARGRGHDGPHARVALPSSCFAMEVRALLMRLAAAIACALVLACAGTDAKPRRAAPPPPPPPAPALSTYAGRDDVMRFAADVAQRRGLDRAWVEQRLAGARHVPAAQRLIMPPSTGTAKNWAAYRARFIEPKRVNAGVQFWREHENRSRAGRGAVRRARLHRHRRDRRRDVLRALHGHFRTLDALATLAFDFPPGRRDRSAFFRDELEQLLVLGQRGTLDVDQVVGSYAGAVGLPQFMPSSLNAYAVDFDGDGRIDLHDSPADAIGSVASYLATFGWRRGMPTHYAANAPEDPSNLAVLLAPDIVPSSPPTRCCSSARCCRRRRRARTTGRWRSSSWRTATHRAATWRERRTSTS